MAVKDRTTKAANVAVTARNIDFVSQFVRNWQGLLDILGITNSTEVAPGTALYRREGHVTLQSGSVNEGDEIPYSQASVTEEPVGVIALAKYSKGTTIEAITKYGYDAAVGKTDEAFRFELAKVVMNKFYAALATGTLGNHQASWQMGLAMAKGLVDNEFKRMNLASLGTVAFVNMLDFYAWEGAASITVQTQFGMNYIQNFMGYRTVFLCSSDEVASGKIYATAVNNLVDFYINPANSDFARAGFEFVTDDVTPFIGFHSGARYSHAVSECYALMGLTLWAEYFNGIAVVTVDPSGATLGTLTVTSVAGTEVGDSKVSITETAEAGGKLYYKAQASTAPAVTYLGALPSGFEAFESGKDYTLTNGHKITVCEVNGSGQVIAAGNTTVVSKTA